MDQETAIEQTMSGLFSWLFDTKSLTPHGLCLTWRPDLIWSFVVSDALIAASYFSIPVVLFTFVSRRKDIVFPWVFLLFGAFILLCGATHATDVLTLWEPAYGVTVLVRVATAIVSVLMAAMLWPLMPQALALPSTTQLRQLNDELGREVTERRRAEDALRDLNADLERRVSDRTLALTESTEKLQAEILERERVEQQLRHSAERLAQFAYVASHDLQEPLRKIAVYADLLEQAIAKSDRDEVARAARVVASSAVRARSLVHNLLAFSRATGSETQAQPLDLRAEVELALSDLSAAIEETRAQVTVDIPPVTVSADRAQLGRLIQNIVSNAIKYHEPGAAPVIDIRAAPVGQAKAELSIVDDGIGFDENFAKEIFQPFKRLAGAAQYAGTGIGLAICKAIADRYGWTIGVRSRPGEGATFTVTLPTVG
jgi:signal transduction histidine kinase